MRDRILISLLTAFLGLLITFYLIRMMPGDIVHMWARKMVVEQGIPYENAYEVAKTRLNYDPSVPVHRQFLFYLSGVLSGNLGTSLYLRVPVAKIIQKALPWTLFIASLALLTSFTLGVLLGLLISWKRKSWLDPIVTLYAAMAQAIPDFIIALILLIVFAINLRLFPLRGAYGVEVTPGLNLPFILDALYHAVLPVAAFTLQTMGTWALAMKGSAMAVLSSDYITVAKAKGLRERRILLNYLGRNAILPLVTTFAIALGTMFSGAMLIEFLFSYPGIGYFLTEALNNRDFPLMQGIFLVTTLAMILFTLMADLLYSKLDPRIDS